MTVNELLEELKGLPGDTLVVIGETVVASTAITCGRVGGDKHWPDTFRATPKGDKRAITFMHYTKLSDGTQGLVRF
jgi:hypothetical protein